MIPAQVGAAVRVHLDAIRRQIAALETATEALGSLVNTFLRYRDATRRPTR